MLDAAPISKYLEAKSSRAQAGRRMKQLQPLRGLRGTPHAEVSRLIAQTWKTHPVRLADDLDVLHELFCTAHEDGLVAMGLVAAALPDEPQRALDLAERWLDMVDDVETADALGWMIYGPALGAAGEPVGEVLASWAHDPRPAVRRMALMGALSRLPVLLEGPTAAGIRARLGEQKVALTDSVDGVTLSRVCTAFLRDSNASVQKALARVLRSWGIWDPTGAEDFLKGIQGGVPKRLREEAMRGISKGRRRSTPRSDPR
jgi:hypothetical protein